MEKIVCEHINQVESVAFCPNQEDADAPLLAIASSALEGNIWHGALNLIDGLSGDSLCSVVFDSGISNLVWCGKDWDYIACAGDDGNIHLIQAVMDVDFTFHKAVDPSKSKSGHSSIVNCLSANTVDPVKLLSGSFDSTIKLWDIHKLDYPLQTFKGHVNHVLDVAWSAPKETNFASVSRDRVAQIWDQRQEAPTLTIPLKYVSCSLDWHPKWESIVSIGMEDGSILTYDVRSPLIPLSAMENHSAPVTCIRYSPFHEDVYASSSDDTTVCLTSDSASGKGALRQVYAEHKDYVRGLGWNHSKLPLLASASWDKSMHIWAPVDLF